MSSGFLTLHNPSQARRYYESGHWQSATIYSLVRSHATQSGDAVAVRERTRSLTYRELINQADQLAEHLHRCGIRPGDRIGYWAPSSAASAICLLACSRAGLVCVPSLHRDHTVSEVATLMDSIGAVAILVDPRHGANADEVDAIAALSALSTMRTVIDLSSHTPAWIDATPQVRTSADGPDAVSYIAFTSGTTGQPKAVMHSDNTLLAAVRAMAQDWDFGSESVVYSLSPLSHNLGFGAMILALTSGGQLVVHDLLRGASLLDRVIETGTTFLFGVPTHAIDLLAEMEQRSTHRLGTVRGFRISGAAVAPNIAEQLLSHGVLPQSGYGMTEAGSHHYTRPQDSAELITGSSGRSYDGFETRICGSDNFDSALPSGQTGHIWLRGPSVTLGYFDNQTATFGAFTDGWLCTGDLGWLDDHGYIHITGRKKEIVVRGGHNIFPAKIEALASDFPGVKACAVVPVPDERLGERACLVIATGDNETNAIDADELLAHLDRGGLSRYDMPEFLAELRSLPLLASGKPAKRAIVQTIEAGDVTPRPIRFQSTMKKAQH